MSRACGRQAATRVCRVAGYAVTMSIPSPCGSSTTRRFLRDDVSSGRDRRVEVDPVLRRAGTYTATRRWSGDASAAPGSGSSTSAGRTRPGRGRRGSQMSVRGLISGRARSRGPPSRTRARPACSTASTPSWTNRGRLGSATRSSRVTWPGRRRPGRGSRPGPRLSRASTGPYRRRCGRCLLADVDQQRQPLGASLGCDGRRDVGRRAGESTARARRRGEQGLPALRSGDLRAPGRRAPGRRRRRGGRPRHPYALVRTRPSAVRAAAHRGLRADDVDVDLGRGSAQARSAPPTARDRAPTDLRSPSRVLRPPSRARSARHAGPHGRSAVSTTGTMLGKDGPGPRPRPDPGRRRQRACWHLVSHTDAQLAWAQVDVRQPPRRRRGERASAPRSSTWRRTRHSHGVV